MEIGDGSARPFGEGMDAAGTNGQDAVVGVGVEDAVLGFSQAQPRQPEAKVELVDDLSRNRALAGEQGFGRGEMV